MRSRQRHADGLLPGKSGWVHWVEVWVAVDVASLQVNDRQVPVHDHGMAVVVWGTKRMPHIEALRTDGSRLGPILLRDWPGY